MSLSPRSFAGPDFTDFFQKAKAAGGVVSWSGDWSELGNTSGGGPTVLAELSKTYGYTPVVIAQFFSQDTGRLLRPLDSATVAAYRDSAAAFAKKYSPRYMGFGIEVNILSEKSPSDFQAFARAFREVHAAVKSASPDTTVFTVFQLERMKGLRGGLFGGANDPASAQWKLLDEFPDADMVAFTTYPGLIYKDPGDIPADYYAEVGSHTSRRIAFTEIGWHSEASPAGWESDDAEQGRFVRRFRDLTGGLSAEVVLWSFLYDQRTSEPFRSMGLLRADGSARPAWEEWTR